MQSTAIKYTICVIVGFLGLLVWKSSEGFSQAISFNRLLAIVDGKIVFVAFASIVFVALKTLSKHEDFSFYKTALSAIAALLGTVALQSQKVLEIIAWKSGPIFADIVIVTGFFLMFWAALYWFYTRTLRQIEFYEQRAAMQAAKKTFKKIGARK